MKRFFYTVLIITGIAGIIGFAYLKWAPVKHIRSINLIPKDAIYLIELSQPVDAWKQIQKSQPWQKLRNHPFFAELNEKARLVDSLLQHNTFVAETFANQPMLISAHMTQATDYDFLILWSMHDITTRLGNLKTILLSLSDYKITERNIQHYTVYELTDRKENTTLFLSFVEDILALSYSPKLLQKAIYTAQNPELAQDSRFIKVQNLVKGNEYISLYLNPRQFNPFLKIYMTDLGSLKDLHTLIDYSAFQVALEEEKIDFNGYVLPKDSTVSILTAMLTSDAGKRPSQAILPDRTAWFTSLGFEDFLQFYDELELQMKNNPQVYSDYQKNIEKIQKFLKINIKKDFLSWISDEVCLVATKPSDSTFHQPELLVYLHTNNIDNAKNHIQFILHQIKKRTKVLKKQVYEYKGFEIHHLQVRGLFKLLFGKLFQKFDMPYLTFIEDFVVFSLDELALQNAIDDYLEKKFLQNNEAFTHFIEGFKEKSSVLTYCNMENLFPLFPHYVSTITWQDIQNNEPYIRLFQHLAFQMTAEEDKFYTKAQIITNPNF